MCHQWTWYFITEMFHRYIKCSCIVFFFRIICFFSFLFRFALNLVTTDTGYSFGFTRSSCVMWDLWKELLSKRCLEFAVRIAKWTYSCTAAVYIAIIISRRLVSMVSACYSYWCTGYCSAINGHPTTQAFRVPTCMTDWVNAGSIGPYWCLHALPLPWNLVMLVIVSLSCRSWLYVNTAKISLYFISYHMVGWKIKQTYT